MYKVYIENNAVVFSRQAPLDPDEQTLLVGADERLTMTKLLQKLQFTKKLTIISENPERVFERFGDSMPFIEAAGGLVTDAAGRALMIFRNGRWDLPKGKLEPGERIEACAVREVGEECSLEQADLRRGPLITHTYHAYRIGGEWVLKRTAWYDMRYVGRSEPRPQTVEGITRAEWISRSRIAELLGGAYHTIRDVFRAAGYDA